MTNPFEQIRDRLSITDVLGRYIELKPNGQNYKACCPFHNEKSPSLIISPAKEIWHCFGCGLGGDIFKFVCLIDNTDKAGALRILAKQANITLEPLRPKSPEQAIAQKQEIDQFQVGLKQLAWSAKIYHQILLKLLSDKDNVITQYCRSRDWSKEIIIKFQLGYAPSGNFLFNLTKQHNINIELLNEVGLLKENNRDKFADRLMVPIFDKTNQVVGFTARVLPHNKNPDRPKYLNSSQSKWFNKSQLWYGQNWHATNIRQLKKALIVEGNMDVIKASQSGFDFGLASQGTSFTIDQLKNLRLLTSNIWLAFDNDNAGIIASTKLFGQAKQLGFEIQKVLIPSKFKDIDEYLTVEKPTELKTMPFLEYYLTSNIHQIQSSDLVVQKETVLQFLELLSYCDPISQDQYLQKLASICKIGLETLRSQIKTKTNLVTTQSPNQNNNSHNFSQDDNLLKNTFWLLLKPQDLDSNRLQWTFVLLKEIIPNLSEFESLQSYYLSNQSEIELVQDNLNTDINTSQSSNQSQNSVIYQKINSFLDHNLNKFILNPDCKNAYIKLKSIV